jgi:thiamine-phosphate pyrophosphorylase
MYEPAFAPCPLRLGLYAVVPNAAWVNTVLSLGVETIQLRIKASDQVYLSSQIEMAVKAARQAGPQIRLFINDHWQQAIAAGAYGVHLGQDDLQRAQLDAIRVSGMRLGISTHCLAEVQRAMQIRPSYIAIGAVYPTTIKAMPTKPLGLDGLRDLAAQASAYPLVAIGGINASRAQSVLACGVGSIAVIRAITEASDPPRAVAALQNCIRTAMLADPSGSSKR